MRTLKVLFFAADPLSADGTRRRLLLDKEAREIESEVVAALHRDNVEFVSCWATRLGDLRRGLLRHRPQIVHFSGHGGSEGLVLESEGGRRAHHVDAAALKEFFSAFRGQIQVVVLNACHSGPQAQAIADAVGCAIGTPSRIMDDAAIIFSASFYSSIAFGESVRAAFDQACATLRMKAFPGEEMPELLVRDGVDASRLVLIPDAEPAPAGPPRTARRGVLWGAGAVGLCGAALAASIVIDPADACAPAREVQRDVQAAGAPPSAPVGLLDVRAASAHPGDPMAGPPALAQARDLHREGRHDADLPLFRQAAEAGNVEAMVALGLAYIRGEGTAVQPDSGIKWLRKAAATRDPWAMNELGEAYVRKDGGGRDLDFQAKHWFEQAAHGGHAEAMRNLGNLYREGRGVAASGSMALEWYAKAARAGFVDAMTDAGLMYEQGGAVPRSAQQAFCWYRAAAEAGSPRGMVAQGRVLEGRREYDDARELYRKAQAAGSAEATYRLGVLYQEGRGVRADRQQAVDHFRRASSAGYRAADSSLAALGEAPASAAN